MLWTGNFYRWTNTITAGIMYESSDSVDQSGIDISWNEHLIDYLIYDITAEVGHEKFISALTILTVYL